jgi:hypothetical protein
MKTQPTSLRLVTTRDAAKIIHQSPSQLSKLRMFGNGPTFVKLGKTVLYEVDALEAWIAQNRRSSVSQAAA